MNKPFTRAAVIALGMAGLLLTGCASTGGKTPAQERAQVRDMASRTLSQLYRMEPSARRHVENAPGYGVFSNIQANVIFITGGGGYGVVYNQDSGKQYDMNMALAGAGLGLGVQDFRAVFVFNDSKTLNDFVTKGWEFGASASAAAQVDDKGGSAAGQASLSDPITVYQITENGLVIQATVAGTKYWIDNDRQYGN